MATSQQVKLAFSVTPTGAKRATLGMTLKAGDCRQATTSYLELRPTGEIYFWAENMTDAGISDVWHQKCRILFNDPGHNNHCVFRPMVIARFTPS